MRVRVVGQIQRKRAPLTELAAHMDLATQGVGEFPADREPQSGSAVVAADTPIGLLEGFEYNLLFVLGDTDPGIDYGESNRSGCGMVQGGLRTVGRFGRSYFEDDGAAFGEL